MANEENQSAAFVTHYLERRASDMAEMHDAWAVESNFNESKSKYEAKEIHQEFMEALEQYGRLEGRRLPFNPIDCSWAQVLKELDKAEEAAMASKQGDGKFLTSKRRQMTTLSKSIVPLLQAIPNDLGISFLQGGLAIIFHLAQNREKVRQSILDTFEDIPQIIAMACSKSKSFPEDIRLHNSIDELKGTLFEAIPMLIEILVPGKFLAKVTSLFRGFKVQDILDCIQRKAKGVEASARNLTDEIIVEMHERTKSIDNNIVEMKDFISNQINDALASKNGMFQMLQDVVSVFLCDEQEPILLMNRPHNAQAASPEQLMTVLQVPLEHEVRDLEFVLKQSKDFDLISKSYGATVLSSPRFQRWAGANETDLIYVEGHLDPSRFGKTSPISYFCANLVRLFADSAKKSITLHFFCGQHVAANNDLQGPRGLVRSLLTQLLQIWPSTPLHGIDLADFEGDHETLSTEDLCQIFQLLLRQVPIQTTVFCIVDDLAQFERDRWDEDFWHVLRMLGTLIVDQESDIRFKVLITTSTKSRRLQDHIPENLRVPVTERDRMMAQRRQQSQWKSAGS